ncbi:DUF4166 domain-containing protein [Hyalangium sp.]|uniref:DUF4166 domain-containing protein n=1 Tax=Hyalangium sp. TaxID=2028555 RepID=UPI002D336046|nr:DUF4166 domain-containing protein [Hyalangium sp.]HYH97627.1 DUF4166 domain-containing protein [Hyalangium sp.]
MAVPAPALRQMQNSSLYAGVLGSRWAGLPPSVRRLHEPGGARGLFTIRRRAGPLSALLGWLSRFPAAGEQVPTRLVVRQDGAVQRWERSFGGHLLTTVQRAREGGLIGERFGPVECVFQLRPVEGGIAYEQVGAWLCVGPWRLSLPRVLAPRVEATATAASAGMRVQVKIGSALAGWLLTYEGLVSPEEESP